VQRVAFEERFAQVVHVVARDIEHGVAHVVESDLARRKEQRELLHLLVGREEIALDAVGDEIERVPVGFLALRLEPSREPVGQRLAAHRFRLDHGAGAVERLEPACFLRAPFEAGKMDYRYGVGRRGRAVSLERGGAVDARLAGRNTDLQYAASGEQRLRPAYEGELGPFEGGLGGQHLALDVTFAVGLCTQTVGRLDRQQRLVAEHGVERLQLSGEMLGKLLG
jgi:hypothetical protein